MGLLHRLAEPCVRGSRRVGDANAGLGGVVEGALECALSLDGGEDAAFVLRTIRNRKVGTAQDAQDDLAILNQGESNGVLVEPEEALGSVDQVEVQWPSR